MGDTRRFAQRMDLIAMAPHPELASTTYCLARVGSEYLVYQPANDSFDMALAEGAYESQWFDMPMINGPPLSGILTTLWG